MHLTSAIMITMLGQNNVIFTRHIIIQIFDNEYNEIYACTHIFSKTKDDEVGSVAVQ